MLQTLLLLSAGIFLVFRPAHAANTLTFPETFKWCTATSAYQIEGGNRESDWWKWEENGHAPASGEAVDHWNLVEQDTELLGELGVNETRLSIEWSRIEPQEGVFDSAAIDHYRNEIEQITARGVSPIVTLQHFTFPNWVRERGGFEWNGLPKAFASFARLVFRDIAPNAGVWITINEPSITLMVGYIAGLHPPGEKRKFPKILPALRGLLVTHAAAYHALHEEALKVGKQIQVGIANHLRTIDPLRTYSPIDRLIANVAHLAFNWTIPDAVTTGYLQFKLSNYFNSGEQIPDLAGTQDFLGLNYYTGDRLGLSLKDGIAHAYRESPTVSDTGWSIYPHGLYRLLIEAHTRYPSLPIRITENGLADADDSRRPDFIRSHLVAIHQAIRKGVPVEGYCHWSLIDNYEWSEGFGPKFGLYAVDRQTMRRTPRPSALLFKDIIRNKGF